MPTRTAEAEWTGDLTSGKGRMKTGSGVIQVPYDFRGRTGEAATATNPEELIGAAHAGCYSMALAAVLTGAGVKPGRIHTTARVHFEKGAEGFSIPRIDLSTEATIPGIDEAAFRRYAEDAAKNCPVSKALAAVDIHFEAKLTDTVRT